MGGLQDIVEIAILSNRLWRGAAQEMAVPSARIGRRCTRIHFLIPEASHQDGYLFGRVRGGGEVPWRTLPLPHEPLFLPLFLRKCTR